MFKDVISLGVAAGLLNLSERRIRQLVKNGSLEVRGRRLIRIVASSLNKYISNRWPALEIRWS
mgnify:CR=1 FL=1